MSSVGPQSIKNKLALENLSELGPEKKNQIRNGVWTNFVRPQRLRHG